MVDVRTPPDAAPAAPASAIYRGWIRHRRYEPVRNEFRYSAFLMYLDLEELPSLFEGRRGWSAKGPAPAWFRRADYLGDPRRPLADCVRERVREVAGRSPEGAVRLLTHLRYWGYCFNPVSFYYCFDRDEKLDAVVAEITNTPWNERHSYVLPVERGRPSGAGLRFRFPKKFHVSPFLDMSQEYDWRMTPPGDRVVVHMESRENDRRMLDATMVLRRSPVTGRNLARVLLRHPFMTGKVIAGIHWQALRLWAKRCPVYPHPAERKEARA